LMLGLSSMGSVNVLCNDHGIRQRMYQVRATGHQI